MTRRADLTLARGIRQARARLDQRAADCYNCACCSATTTEARDLLAAALELYERDAPSIVAESPPLPRRTERLAIPPRSPVFFDEQVARTPRAPRPFLPRSTGKTAGQSGYDPIEPDPSGTST
jgi:hypothetical protein